MFSFPVTVPIRTDESIYPMDVTVAIDEIAIVKPLDKSPFYGVESSASGELLPSSEIVFVDGRTLPVLETPATINRYLDAYRTLDHFFTAGRAANVEEQRPAGVVVPLFKTAPCDSSEGSTPA